MNPTYIKKFSGTPFQISCVSVQNAPGTWNSTKVSIFRDEILIGEYLRNYSNFGPQTFFPFKVDDEWYALYSTNYTASRVMKLHEDRIEDWCGESSSANGFCPTAYYIPQYNKHSNTYDNGGSPKTYDYYYCDTESESEDEFLSDRKADDFVETKYCNFAFMSGCIWGDDTSWKLRYIDLSKISQKELIIEEKFGYWQLPNNLSLRQCINMSCWEPGHQWVELTKMEHVNLTNGERD